MDTIGIDFGTTNTVLAFPQADGQVRVQDFAQNGTRFEAVRTALSFRRNSQSGGPPVAEVGQWAIEDFIDAPEDRRFLQSFKSFAASASFGDTAIFTKRHKFEDLVLAFMKRLGEHAGLTDFPPHLVVGRPVTFAGQTPDDGLARRRYDAAFGQLGAKTVHYVLEPVAAAHFYAQRLTRNAVILVGDFGGGTSDFSILRFKLGKNGVRAEALGHSGIGIAGDSFDYRIIDNVVSPRLGKGSTYLSWGKTLPIPVHYFTSFSRWNELCLMRRPEVLRDLRDLAKTSDASSGLLALVDLIEGGVSYELYRTVSRVKAELSHADSAVLDFKVPGIAIKTKISRTNFESWIAADLDRIGACVDRGLAQAGLTSREIDRVFITGGTSYVPAVRRLFEQRFPADRIDTGEQLLSIAKGLALIGAAGRAEDWAVAS